jgi:hypothetical protein
MDLYFESVIKCIENTLKISSCFSMKMCIPIHDATFMFTDILPFHYVYCHIYIDTSIVRVHESAYHAKDYPFTLCITYTQL